MESKLLPSAPSTGAGSGRPVLWAAWALSACSFWIACSGVALKAPTIDSTTKADTRVVLVSLDGFRWDFASRADTPNLDSLANEGIRAEKLLSAFPTKTFPNHYTLVTGLWPSNHGIVGNNVRDPELEARFGMSNREAVADARWWGGEPIWVTAEKQGFKSAPLFWPGSEAPIKGVRPAYWEPYQSEMSNADRVDKLLSWIDLPEPDRPRFLTLYASDVDSAAHGSDPDSSPEVATAVARVDAMVGRLLAGLEQRGLADSTHVIIVSDHGMSATSADRVIPVDDYIDLEVANPMDMGAVLTLWPGRELTVERLEAAFARRIEWARRAPGPVPIVPRRTVEKLIARATDDVRTMEGMLYEAVQRTEKIGDIVL